MKFARLVVRTTRHNIGLLAGMTAILSGFQVLLVVIAANVQREGLFEQLGAFLPPFVQTALGGGLIASFGGFVAFGFFHPIVVLALAIGAAYLSSELAGDVESGLVDLIAARPVRRGTLVRRTAAVVALAAAAIIGAMLAANRVATAMSIPAGVAPPSIVPLAKLAVNLAAVTWCCGGAGLAIAAFARRRAGAAGSATLLLITLYLVNFAASWWQPLRPIALVSPFHYFDPAPVLLGTHDPRRDILLLLAAAAGLAAVAHAQYARRDL